MSINELIQKAHSQAKLMGFWDEERNVSEALMLIVSECGEALEAHRSGKFCPDGPRRVKAELDFPPSMASYFHGPEPGIKELYEAHVKGSFEEELADIVIRIADLCGGLKIGSPACPADGNGGIDVSKDNVGQALLGITRSICRLGMFPSDSLIEWQEYTGAAIIATFSLARHHNIDLWRHIELKLAYNKTRGVRHGKAY